MSTAQTITVESTINAPVAKVWEYWTSPERITQWSHASDDWYTPYAENDLRTGGKFLSRMAARDGSVSFDFGGEYSDVQLHERIAYTLGDGRKVDITFTANDNETRVVQVFEPESTNPLEMQQGGWQAIMDNFKKYVEA